MNKDIPHSTAAAEASLYGSHGSRRKGAVKRAAAHAGPDSVYGGPGLLSSLATPLSQVLGVLPFTWPSLQPRTEAA